MSAAFFADLEQQARFADYAHPPVQERRLLCPPGRHPLVLDHCVVYGRPARVGQVTLLSKPAFVWLAFDELFGPVNDSAVWWAVRYTPGTSAVGLGLGQANGGDLAVAAECALGLLGLVPDTPLGVLADCAEDFAGSVPAGLKEVLRAGCRTPKAPPSRWSGVAYLVDVPADRLHAFARLPLASLGGVTTYLPEGVQDRLAARAAAAPWRGPGKAETACE